MHEALRHPFSNEVQNERYALLQFPFLCSREVEMIMKNQTHKILEE